MVILVLALGEKIHVDTEQVVLYMATVELALEAVGFALLIGWFTQ